MDPKYFEKYLAMGDPDANDEAEDLEDDDDDDDEDEDEDDEEVPLT